MTIIATAIKGRDLKPGDLFSIADQAYWSSFRDRSAVGEKVYIRTESPASADGDMIVYKIEVQS